MIPANPMSSIVTSATGSGGQAGGLAAGLMAGTAAGSASAALPVPSMFALDLGAVTGGGKASAGTAAAAALPATGIPVSEARRLEPDAGMRVQLDVGFELSAASGSDGWLAALAGAGTSVDVSFSGKAGDESGDGDPATGVPTGADGAIAPAGARATRPLAAAGIGAGGTADLAGILSGFAAGRGEAGAIVDAGAVRPDPAIGTAKPDAGAATLSGTAGTGSDKAGVAVAGASANAAVSAGQVAAGVASAASGMMQIEENAGMAGSDARSGPAVRAPVAPSGAAQVSAVAGDPAGAGSGVSSVGVATDASGDSVADAALATRTGAAAETSTSPAAGAGAAATRAVGGTVVAGTVTAMTDPGPVSGGPVGGAGATAASADMAATTETSAEAAASAATRPAGLPADTKADAVVPSGDHARSAASKAAETFMKTEGATGAKVPAATGNPASDGGTRANIPPAATGMAAAGTDGAVNADPAGVGEAQPAANRVPQQQAPAGETARATGAQATGAQATGTQATGAQSENGPASNAPAATVAAPRVAGLAMTEAPGTAGATVEVSVSIDMTASADGDAPATPSKLAGERAQAVQQAQPLPMAEGTAVKVLPRGEASATARQAELDYADAVDMAAGGDGSAKADGDASSSGDTVRKPVSASAAGTQAQPVEVQRPGVSAAALAFAAAMAESDSMAGEGGDPFNAPIEIARAEAQASVSTAALRGSTAALPQNAVVASAHLAAEVARFAQKGQTRFQIRMDPPELGRVDVELKVSRDGSVRAHLTVERSETLDLFMRDQRGLERALDAAGLKLESGGLEMSLKNGEGGFAGFAGGEAGEGGGPSTGSGETEMEAEMRPVPAKAHVSGASGALDIQI